MNRTPTAYRHSDGTRVQAMQLTETTADHLVAWAYPYASSVGPATWHGKNPDTGRPWKPHVRIIDLRDWEGTRENFNVTAAPTDWVVLDGNEELDVVPDARFREEYKRTR